MSYNSPYTGQEIDNLKDLGLLLLTAQTTVAMTLADTYYPITGTFNGSPCDLCTNFTPNGTGSITYNGSGNVMLIDGTSDLSLSGAAAATITYGLFKNGSLVAGAESPTAVNFFNLLQTLSITSAIDSAENDVYDVRVKCDDAGRTLTVRTLNVRFKGA